MKILVCGGRDFTEIEFLYKFLDEFQAKEQPESISHLIHGGARGADLLAGAWAKDRGIQEVICPANWQAKGKSAGYARNCAMAMLNPDVVIAFHGGKGTAMMIDIATEWNIDVVIV